MRLFTSNSLALMRSINESNLPHRAFLQGRGRTRRPGGITDQGTWTTLRDYPCRLSAATEALAESADQTRAKAKWVLVLPANAIVTAQQRAIIEGETAGKPWTETVLITGVDEPSSIETMRKCYCDEAPAE